MKADFETRESFAPKRLRVYWSWNATGRWIVPNDPRVAFAPRPFLYKLILVLRTGEGLEQYANDPQLEFMNQLLPELEKTLFPGKASALIRTNFAFLLTSGRQPNSSSFATTEGTRPLDSAQ